MSSPFQRLSHAVLFLTALATPAIAQAPVPPLLSGVTRIVTLGDSITEGGGQPGGYVWLHVQSAGRGEVRAGDDQAAHAGEEPRRIARARR